MKKIITLITLFCISCMLNAQVDEHAHHEHLNADNPNLFPKNKLLADCKFFGTDSLVGFPLEAEVDALLKVQHHYSELRAIVRNKEIAFVKAKYHVNKLPFEIAEESRVIHTNTPMSVSCDNIGFDDTNDMGGWTGYYGNNQNSANPLTLVTGPLTSPAFTVNPGEFDCEYFGMVNAASGNDPLGGFSLASPLGGNAVKMGGEYRNLGGACETALSGSKNHTSGEVLERTFSVTPNNTEFQYAFAFVYYDDGSHAKGTQPYFRVEVLDASGASITCLNYYQQGNVGTPPPGYSSDGTYYSNVYYTPGYLTSSLNLLPYLGTNVTIRFTVTGCTLTAHFGYAYVDCACAPLALIIPQLACLGGTDVLTAPAQSGGTYSWTGPGIVGTTTTQVINANVSGTYSVTVTNANKCKYTIDTTITFYPPPTLAVTSATTCAGGTTTLTASETGNSGALSYVWKPSTGITFSPGDSAGAITPVAASCYTVTGTSIHGCTNTAVGCVSINANPAPTFTAPPVCIGSASVFTVTSAGSSTYAWNFGDGSAIDNTAGPSHTYAASGNHAVTLTVTTISGCKGVGTTTVVVNPNPTATFSANPVCTGAATNFTTNVTPTTGATYSWAFGDPAAGISASTSNPTVYTYAANGLYNVTLTVSVGSCSVVATNTALVAPVPTASFSVAPVCMGTPSIFDASASTPTVGATYNWSFGGAAPNTATVVNNPNTTHPYSTASTFPVTLIVSVGSCSATATGNAVVNPNATATFSTTPVCFGQSTVFTSTITNATTYTWTYGDGGGTSASANPTNTYTAPGTYIATLTVSAVGGCSVTVTNSVVVNIQPTASFTVGPVCQNTASFFDGSASTPTPTAGVVFYNWSYGGAAPNTGTVGPTSTHVYQAPGTFPVSLLVTVGSCTATATGSAVVNPFPTLGFTADHPCDGTGVNFTNTTTNPGSISTWSWTLGDGATTTSVTPTQHPYAGPGCYTVVLTATATTGCSGSFDTIVYVHPNPVAAFTANNVCVGLATTFVDGSSVTNPSSCLTDKIASWNWNFGDNQTATNTTPPGTFTHTYANCGPYNITLQVTTNNNCIATYTVTGDTVYCTPVVTAPANITTCPNMPVAAQNFVTTVTNGGPAHAIWAAASNNTGLTSTNGIDVVNGYTSSANTSCSNLTDVITAQAVSTAGCKGNTASYTVTLYPTPSLSVMPNYTVCANASLAVAPYTACPANSTVAWSANPATIGITSGTGNIPAFTAIDPNPAAFISTTAVVTGIPTSANNCVGPPLSFNILVNPIPAVTATSETVCPNYGAQSNNMISISTNLQPGGATASWTNNNIAIGLPASGTTAPAPYLAPTNTTLATITGNLVFTPIYNGCTGPTYQDTIVIKPTPFTQHIVNQYLCPDQFTTPVNFSILPAPTGADVLTYAWSYSNNGFPANGTSNPFPKIGPLVNTGNTTHSTIVTVQPTLNGCLGPDSMFTISVYPKPVANFSFSYPVCLGAFTSFTDMSASGSNIPITQWNWNFGNQQSSVVENPDYTFTSSGLQTVTLIVTNNPTPLPPLGGCRDTITKNPFVNAIPVALFTGDSLKSCPQLKTNFTSQSTDATSNIVSWNWTFGNGQTSTLQNPPQQNYTNSSATQSAYFSVSLVVTSDSGCVSPKNTKSNYIQVYPRPIADFSWGPSGADIDDPRIDFVNESQGVSEYLPSKTYGPNGIQYYLGDVFTSVPSQNNVYTNQNFFHVYEHYDPYTYYVTQWVINSQGCTDSITKPVEILPDFTFYIPNAFSPNGDGTNEGFKGTGIGIDLTTYNLWVFDRWGLQIFYSNDLEQVWDGHMRGNEDKPILQQDVYVWKVKFRDFTGKKHEYHGTVTLLK